MTEVLQSPSHFPSPSSSSPVPRAALTANDRIDGLRHQQRRTHIGHALISSPNSSSVDGDTAQDREEEEEEEEEEEGGRGRGRGRRRKERDGEGDQVSLLALLVTVVRKSWITCAADSQELSKMEIGLPTNVRHVAHVTFDRFNGFLGLPVEFEPEVPRRPPSASASVFGVSTESMQLSFDSRGNSVPTILLLMQKRLYAQGGLQAEGIFRINADNSQEEYVRDQLNRGVVPDGVDVHCLAGLIKAWFRELPTGVLDSLSPEQVMQSQSEEECAQLMRFLPPTEAALLDWAINLMADVAELEHVNKMNARNVAMVFAPNMTHMADPLTALMYAVQVMNFLKTLIIKTLRDRKDCIIETAPILHLEPSDESDHHGSSQSFLGSGQEANEGSDEEQSFVAEEPPMERPHHLAKDDSIAESDDNLVSTKNFMDGGNGLFVDSGPGQVPAQANALTTMPEETGSNGANRGAQPNNRKTRKGQSSSSNLRKGHRKLIEQPVRTMEKSKGSSIVSRINSSTERIEAWR